MNHAFAKRITQIIKPRENDPEHGTKSTIIDNAAEFSLQAFK
jgi:hypothetical protein